MRIKCDRRRRTIDGNLYIEVVLQDFIWRQNRFTGMGLFVPPWLFQVVSDIQPLPVPASKKSFGFTWYFSLYRDLDRSRYQASLSACMLKRKVFFIFQFRQSQCTAVVWSNFLFFSHNILLYLPLLHLSSQPVSQKTLTRRKVNCCQYIKPEASQPFCRFIEARSLERCER